MPITAVKPVYNRKTRTYEIEVVEDADPGLVQHGYFVYDSAAHCIPRIEEGRLLGHWNEAKRAAVLAHLRGKV